MDSTLIQTEVIVELAKRAGVGEEVDRITEAAMRGEIDFSESFKQRVALLKGLDVSVMQEIAENLPITEGTQRVFHTLKNSVLKQLSCPVDLLILASTFNACSKLIMFLPTTSKLSTVNLQVKTLAKLSMGT